MRALLLAATLLATAAPAFAQAPPQRIRGTIASVAGDALVLKDRDGSDVAIQLAPDTVVRADTAATLEAIKPGSMLAIVSRGSADKQEAVAVRAMAAGIPLRMAILPWDLLPESTMTNAVVEGQQVAASGQVMSLKSGDKTVEMTFPANAVIAIEDNGDRAMLVPGAHVVIFAVPGTGTTMSGRVVIVGVNGLTPPV